MVVPLISLVDQTVARFVANGINPADIGVMQADHPLRWPQAPGPNLLDPDARQTRLS